MVAQSMSTMDMALKRCARNCRNTYSFAARGQVDQWIETHVTFIADKPKLFKATRPSQAAYRHGRQDGARQAIGLKETGAAGNWTLEK